MPSQLKNFFLSKLNKKLLDRNSAFTCGQLLWEQVAQLNSKLCVCGGLLVVGFLLLVVEV
jgi:hypothetical protein